MTILEYLRKNNISIAADCGGNGTCGRCLVRIDGMPGLHKACKTKYEDGMSIQVLDNDSIMEAPGSSAQASIRGQNSRAGTYCDTPRYGIAVDIGTTTIAAVIIDMSTGKSIAESTAMNSCRVFGSDVISRIRASSEGHREEMSLMMRNDLSGIITSMILGSGIHEISAVSISANTTMVHILMGYEAASLGSFPYKPVNIAPIEGNFGELIGDRPEFLKDVKVYIMPGISAFIGGDIVSGLYHLKFHESADINAFMDLGTNGEMAAGSRDGIITASASAGPVFEGGSVSCGTGSIPGAVSHVHIIRPGDVRVSTIKGMPASGICGTGVTDAVAEMYRMGMIDSTGLMRSGIDPLRIASGRNGKAVTFTQKDVRAFQLAKAAIRAGFEMMLDDAGITAGRVKKLYMAGGMGFSLDSHSAALTGLVPEELSYRMESAGNTSLAGAADMITGDIEKNLDEIHSIVRLTTVTDFALDEEFKDRYLEYMNF